MPVIDLQIVLSIRHAMIVGCSIRFGVRRRSSVVLVRSSVSVVRCPSNFGSNSGCVPMLMCKHAEIWLWLWECGACLLLSLLNSFGSPFHALGVWCVLVPIAPVFVRLALSCSWKMCSTCLFLSLLCSFGSLSLCIFLPDSSAQKRLYAILLVKFYRFLMGFAGP